MGRKGAVVSTVPTIKALASAVPPARSQEDLWDGFFRDHFRGVKWAERIYRSAGPHFRHPAIDPTVEDISQWSTAARMRRYLSEAMPLAKQAASQVLSGTFTDASEVGLLAVVSCTGYSTPGLDICLARDLGLPADAQRLLIGHMGCHAALPALGIVSDWVAQRGRPALLVSVELSSLHLQPEQLNEHGGACAGDVLAHALFSDAAAAVLVGPADKDGDGAPVVWRDDGAVGTGAASARHARSFTVVGVEACTDLASAGEITWEITDTGFRMGLGRSVPQVVGAHVRPTVERLLGRVGLGIDDVRVFGAHPGGSAVLDAVAKALSLGPGGMDASRRALADYGNCSSATILLVLEELLSDHHLSAGDHVVLLAFGPGLTIYAALLEASAS